MAKDRKKPGKQESERTKSPKGAGRRASRHVDAAPDGPGGFTAADRPALVLTVDVVVLAVRKGGLSVLLVERVREPQRGTWALPGTVVEPHEALSPAATRAVAARTGVAVDPGRLEQVATFAEPGRDPRTRVVSVGLVAVVERATAPAGGSVASGRWWSVDKVFAKKGAPLAFDHTAILAAGVESVAGGLEWSDLATGLVEEPFTLGDLRRVYEAVWGAPLEPANFRRKVLASPGFVRPTGGLRTVTTGRPAELYRRGDGGRLTPPLVRPR